MYKNENLFSFFDDLLESNSFENRKHIALNQFKEDYPSFIQSIDEEKGIIKMYAEDGLSTYNFEKDFENEIIDKCKTLKNNIDKTVIEIIKNTQNYKGYLEQITKHLIFLINRVDVVYPATGIIKIELKKLVIYLIERYSLKTSYKNALSKEINKFSLFDIKSNVKKSKLISVYDIAVNLEIIDDEIVSEEAFISVLSGNPTKTDDAIIFKSNNQISVYFLNSIAVFFNSFTPSKISQSKSFYNKQGKLFNQNDIDVANNRLQKNTFPIISEIKELINKV